ncbi:DoxX family membrane protein [uncultured Sneathiella sp.]|uniref:DoxX family membrane protein n=1 Tax=uncultured Sneathiella sp. TaxID=879315 RepID=UPI002597CB37|nr:DoxX family membrane protein [uncultured Sneathiella sp.]
MTKNPDSCDAVALLILRLGLAWFLFVWAVNKVSEPEQYMRIWGYFHGIDIGATMPYVMGAAQIIICVMAALGLWRTLSYGLLFLMHLVTVIVIFPSLIAPFVIEDGFPVNRNNSIALATLAAFAALWMLRHRDHYSLDAWLQRRRRERRHQVS